MNRDYCDETVKGQTCLLCGGEGTWDRPVVTIDDWYPKPPPPSPDPDPRPWHEYLTILVLLIIAYLCFSYVISHGF